MKKKYLLIIISFLIGGYNCSDSFLDIDHYDIIEPGSFFSNEENIIQGLNGLYDMFYPEWGGSDIQQSWNIKPQLAFSNYPALDCQASGWDNEFTRHDWRADKDMFEDSWKQCYKAIDRANRFLMNLREVDASLFADGESTKNTIIAETRAIRAFFYFYLAQNFGRIPMLMEGETYSTTPHKARAESVQETYDLIIEDFSFAAGILDWEPWNGEYGRITKGMAKSYLAQVYMYKGNFEAAKKELKDVIDSKTYDLEECFGLIHVEDSYWSKESVWEIAYPHHGNLNWGANATTDALWWPAFLTASPDYGGWGSLFISYEFCESFEQGDKRKVYSVVERGNVHPYTGERIDDEIYKTSENMPNNYSIKLWKRHPGSDGIVMNPQSAIWLRYSAVLLNYAECLFETEENGWLYIDQVRDRAWGKLEPAIAPTKQEFIPIELNNNPDITVPDAQTYYTAYKALKGYNADVWKIALTMERRHEFLAEYSFWYDLTRTGMAQEFLDKEYPKGQGFTNRKFDYQPYRDIYPIPYLEIITNKLIGPENQNPGY